MENFKGILILAVIALAGASLLLFTQYRSADAKADEAQLLGAAVRDLLRAGRVPCSAGPEQYGKMAACIQPLLAQKDFKEDAFKQPDPKTGAAGYLVVRNVNRKAYDAERFTFLYNRDLLQTGCLGLAGAVDQDVTCRFEFSARCEAGTVLEVNYPFTGDDGVERTARVFLKTC